jgi:hypothetical protein
MKRLGRVMRVREHRCLVSERGPTRVAASLFFWR